MRVLHVDTGRTLRGGQRQVLLLLRELAALGVEQTLLARGDLRDEARRGGFEARAFGWGALRAAARRADVIHVHDARAHTAAAVLSGGRPVVVARRVAFPVRGGVLSRWKYGRAARLPGIAGGGCGLEKAGVAAGRIRVIPDAVDVRRRDQFQRSVVALAIRSGQGRGAGGGVAGTGAAQQGSGGGSGGGAGVCLSQRQ